MSKPKDGIEIEDMSDGFAIVITKDGKENRTYFDQEDTRKDLVKVFKDLGHKNVSYREVY